MTTDRNRSKSDPWRKDTLLLSYITETGTSTIADHGFTQKRKKKKRPRESKWSQ
jgi:hypothetical protein